MVYLNLRCWILAMLGSGNRPLSSIRLREGDSDKTQYMINAECYPLGRIGWEHTHGYVYLDIRVKGLLTRWAVWLADQLSEREWCWITGVPSGTEWQ